MARIANKKTGKLTKQYRDPSVFHASARRGRPKKLWKASKKTTKRNTTSMPKMQNVNYQEMQPSNTGCMGCLTFFIVVAVIISIIAMAIPNNNDKENTNNQTSEITETTETEHSIQEIDLSAFEGDCGVSAKVDIEKEADTHLMDVNILATNTSQKKISTLILYFVKCYDDNTVLESWEYCDRLKFEDIAVNETKHSRWVLGTTTLGAREYRVYVGYVLFEDGTEWGTEKIDHAAVVTRGVEADVYAYGSGIKETADTVEKQYVVTYSAKVVKNPSVGDAWSFGMKNGDTFFKSGEKITVSVAENRGPKLTIYANESDAQKDDFGQKDIVFTDIAVGQSETIIDQVMVTENEGKYIGRDAFVEFKVTAKCVDGGTQNKTDTETTEGTNKATSTSAPKNESTYLSTEDMNKFLVHYILPQYVSVSGELHDAIEYDSNESTDWCYKLVGYVGNDKYEAMVYPFQLGKGNEITDLWIRYLYWNGNLIVENASSEQINYSPKKYW